MKQYRKALCKLITQAIERFGREDIIVAEVGIKKAETSAEVMTQFPRIKMVLIDPWERLPDSHPSISVWHDEPYSQEVWDQLFMMAVENLKPFLGQWILYRMKSEAAAPLIMDSSIHVLFIDSCHFSCGEEIERWWPKVAPGGICSGDDFSAKRARLDPPEKRRWDTRLAPTQFAERIGLPLTVDGRVWSIVKL